MSRTETEQPEGETGNGPYRIDEEIFEELASVEIDPPVWVFAPGNRVVYYVLEECDAPAGQLRVEPEGVLTEWVDCEPDARVFEGVSLPDLHNTPGEWNDISTLRTAISNGRIIPRPLPESHVLPVFEQFIDQIEDGRFEGRLEREVRR